MEDRMDIMDPYPEDENDFGFTTFEEEPQVDLKSKLNQMNKLVRPLLEQLMKDADNNPNIKWPNRKEVLTKMLKEMDKILED